jgi:hypothetical protein
MASFAPNEGAILCRSAEADALHPEMLKSEEKSAPKEERSEIARSPSPSQECEPIALKCVRMEVGVVPVWRALHTSIKGV